MTSIPVVTFPLSREEHWRIKEIEHPGDIGEDSRVGTGSE